MSETKECFYCEGNGGFWHDEAPNVWITCPKCGGRGRVD